MTRFLAEAKGFTPIIDVIVEDVGLMPAVVFGVVWRYCQMKDGVCRASLERIAKRVSVGRKTVERHIKRLCDEGYLQDLTPEVRYKPHIYANTGKVQIIGKIAAARSQTESPTKPDRSDRESDRGKTESPTRSDRESNPGKTESPIKILLKDTLQETKTPDALRAPAADSPDSFRELFPGPETTGPEPTPAGQTPEEYQLWRTRTALEGFYARAEGEPWLHWGNESSIVQKYHRPGVNKSTLLKLCYQLEQAFGLHPVWGNASHVKFWMREAANLVEACECDLSLVVRVGRDMRASGLTIASPKSLFEKTISAMAIERIGGKDENDDDDDQSPSPEQLQAHAVERALAERDTTGSTTLPAEHH